MARNSLKSRYVISARICSVNCRSHIVVSFNFVQTQTFQLGPTFKRHRLTSVSSYKVRLCFISFWGHYLVNGTQDPHMEDVKLDGIFVCSTRTVQSQLFARLSSSRLSGLARVHLLSDQCIVLKVLNACVCSTLTGAPRGTFQSCAKHLFSFLTLTFLYWTPLYGVSKN